MPPPTARVPVDGLGLNLLVPSPFEFRCGATWSLPSLEVPLLLVGNVEQISDLRGCPERLV